MTNYRPGDEIKIGDATITLTSRKGSSGRRYSWIDRLADIAGEGYYPTPEQAIVAANRALSGPSCAHDWPTALFCPACHDSES